MRTTHSHNVTTYAHRDYSNNGSPMIISRSEAKEKIDRFNAKYKAGKITAGEREIFTRITALRTVPIS